MEYLKSSWFQLSFFAVIANALENPKAHQMSLLKQHEQQLKRLEDDVRAKIILTRNSAKLFFREHPIESVCISYIWKWSANRSSFPLASLIYATCLWFMSLSK